MNLEQIYQRLEKKILARGYREGRAEAKAQAKAQAKAEAVLIVLAARGLTVTAAQRKQVLACTDSAQIDAWLRAAGTTANVKALFSSSAQLRPRSKRG